jgi:hypothetical protein
MLHRGMRDRMRFASKARIRSGLARFGAPASRALGSILLTPCSSINVPVCRAHQPVGMWTTQERYPHTHRPNNNSQLVAPLELPQEP